MNIIFLLILLFSFQLFSASIPELLRDFRTNTCLEFGVGYGRSPEQVMKEGHGTHLELTNAFKYILEKEGYNCKIVLGTIQLTDTQKNNWHSIGWERTSLLLGSDGTTLPFSWLQVDAPALPDMLTRYTLHSPYAMRTIELFPALSGFKLFSMEADTAFNEASHLDEAGIHAAMRGTDMLLQEGMNIKVLLLPDGDDPDSFARKHTAQQFKEYIEQHKKDFIQFKTDLMLNGVTDPQKRSEAVSSILKSVSVIPDSLRRTTYLSECAHRLHVREDALVSTVNKYIQKEKEDRQKERERTQSGLETDGLQPDNDLVVPIGLHTAQEQASEVERLLIQNVIRHGEEIIFEGLEAEDGSTVNMNVAQFIDYDLGTDGLTFSNELFNRILREAVEHSEEQDFKADQYFIQHPDPDISRLAATLGIDNHQLSRSFEMRSDKDSLRQRVQHLILDFRLDIINQHLKDIQKELKEVGTDWKRMKPLMIDYKQTQEIRDALAKQRGSDVII